MTKFVPYSESLLSHCGNESHRYCELFVSLAHPEGNPVESSERGTSGSPVWSIVGGVKLPGWLAYAPNHMWLDRAGDGTCHIGVDDFLVRLLGHIEKLSFVVSRGVDRPTAVMTVRGVDLHLAFPNQAFLRETNTYLRTNPDKILSNPYTLGWLFEGTSASGPDSDIGAGLLKGKDALAWMERDVRRLSSFVREELASRQPDLGTLMADGGTVAEGLAQHLTREEILKLFNDFFSPYARGRIS